MNFYIALAAIDVAGGVGVVGVSVVFHMINSPEHTSKSTTPNKKTCKKPRIQPNGRQKPVPKPGKHGFPRAGAGWSLRFSGGLVAGAGCLVLVAGCLESFKRLERFVRVAILVGRLESFKRSETLVKQTERY